MLEKSEVFSSFFLKNTEQSFYFVLLSQDCWHGVYPVEKHWLYFQVWLCVQFCEETMGTIHREEWRRRWAFNEMTAPEFRLQAAASLQNRSAADSQHISRSNIHTQCKEIDQASIVTEDVNILVKCYRGLIASKELSWRQTFLFLFCKR